LKSLSKREFQILITIAGIAVLVLASLVIANLIVLGQVGVGGEFLLPWKAARAYLFEHIEPYSTTVSGFVQEQVYGRTARTAEDPYLLEVPFHLVLLYFPFGLFRDPKIAGAIWNLLCQAGFLGFIFLSLRLANWAPQRFFLVAFFISSALSLYAMTGFLEGSQIFLLGLIYAGILLALSRQMDELAGMLIALVFYQWEVGFLFLLFVFLRVFDQQRWRVLAGFGMVTGLLLAISFLVYPGWVIPFLRAQLASLRADFGFSPGIIFGRLWPDFGSQIAWTLTLLLVILLIMEWSAVRRAEFHGFYWTACLTLAVAPLFGFRTEPENLVVMILPWAFILSVVRERWKAGYWLASLLLLLVFLVPWALFSSTVFTEQIRRDVIFLFLPVITVIGLYWTRWWALRPPRTWMERAVNTEYR
jgi:hypothetical protein